MKTEKTTIPPAKEQSLFKVAAYTADPDNPLLLKLLRGPSDPFTGVGLHDTSKQSGVEGLINMIDDVRDADLVITDYPGNSLRFISKIDKNTNVFFEAFEEEGNFKNVIAMPLTDNPDALLAINDAFTEYGSKPNYVIVLQALDNDRTDYSQSRTPAYTKMVEDYRSKGFNILEHEFPRLTPNLRAAGDLYSMGYLDEALIQTASLKHFDKMAFRDAYRRVVEFFILIGFDGANKLNILTQQSKGGVGKTTFSAMLISAARRADFKETLQRSIK